MSRGQRLGFLGIAVAVAIVAVIVLAGGGEDKASPPVRASQTPAPRKSAAPKPPPLLEGGKVTRLQYTEGDTVRFRVVSDVPEEVHVHGYDIAKDLEPGKTTTVSFKATITGLFEIEYEHAGEQIGELRVDPK